MKRINKKIISFAIYMMVTVLMVPFIAGCSSQKSGNTSEAVEVTNPHDVSVLFINAGRADSILVQVDDKNYLIDTGEKESAEAICSALEKQGVQKLDAVFLTHTHSDHIGGLEKVSKKYTIEKVYSASISMNKDNGKNKITNAVGKLNLDRTTLNAGDAVKIDDTLSFEVLGPLEYNDDDDNDNSLVLRLQVNGRTFLFTGDMQFAEEETLLNAGIDVKADVLKVGNHGNKDATSEAFAKAVSPQIAVITTNITDDPGSASARVRALFNNCDLYIEDQGETGILVTVGRDGSINASKI